MLLCPRSNKTCDFSRMISSTLTHLTFHVGGVREKGPGNEANCLLSTHSYFTASRVRLYRSDELLWKWDVLKLWVSQVKRVIWSFLPIHVHMYSLCSGAQGEFAGLCTIMAYHCDRGEQHRKICLVPESAHGTNAASCQMAGLRVITLPTDRDGGVPLEVFKEQVCICMHVCFPSSYGGGDYCSLGNFWLCFIFHYLVQYK